MIFANSYACDLYRQQQARKDHGEKTRGAEKTLSKDKDTAKKIAEHEYQSENIAHFYSEMARLNRLGMNPSREILENIYDR